MIPRTVFEEEHEQFRTSVRRFLQEEAQPYHEQWEKDGQVDREIWRKAGAQGYLAPQVPEAYGGAEADFRYNAVIDEEVSRSGCSGLGWSVHSDIAVPYIINYGTDAQKEKYLPACVAGDIVMAIAMSEPGRVSYLLANLTTAIADGDEYVINGSKTFITNGQHADLVIVVCKTDPDAGAAGTSLILVEGDRAGFERGRNLDKVGMKAQDTSELFFNEVRVPKENLLGEEGKGFVYLMQELPQERLTIGLMAMAASRTVLEQTIEYVKERNAFGRPIATFQNTQFKLAEMDTELTAAEVFMDKCLELLIQGKLDTVTASKSKLLGSEVQCRIIDECVQLHGGYGYMWEYPIARAYADARVQRIYGGTSEVMKLIIGRSMVA